MLQVRQTISRKDRDHAKSLLAAVSAAQDAGDPIETLLVTGEQPGPGLWKVSRGDHVLWILGGSGPLPKDMVWRSGEVEARVAESQEVLHSGFANVGLDVGLLRALTLLPTMLKAAKNLECFARGLEDLEPDLERARGVCECMGQR